MKIAFNPSTVAALTSPPDNKDITFDLRGHNIFARGVKFQGTDTNTWRDIKINNVSIGSHTLDLRNGSNTTLTNTNGVVIINSTWRPVVDNLTSDSTTSSLSANQGRVLAGLINGKSDSDHNHDDRYLKLTGGVLTGNLIGTSAMFSGRFYGNRDDEGIIIKPASNGYAGLILGTHDGERSIFYFVKNKPFWRYSHGSDNLDIIHPKKSGTIALTSDIPSSLKNPYALTISLNGTSQGPYDGSAAKNINITPGSIGAATSDHNHDGRYVYNYGGIQMDGASVNKNALGMTTNSGITGDWWHILQAAWNDEYRWNSQIAFPTQNRNGMYYRSGLNDNTKWGSWVKLLDTNNYSSTLDSRYYTESEVNSLLSKKLDRVNLTTGSWNPRDYHLAADYCYNGGDLSISENSGQIHVSIDGYFWQNEGNYRVLDTSDVAGLKGNLTVHQYLSATDVTWWPLIWGGNSHNNTNDSTGAVYKSHDKLSWQTGSQTLYATNIRTENIRHLSIGGGIYWNPNVESASDGSDAASITLVKSGVAGGTTLVLSQMNDANDTIQFKTNAAARLYHNSYPILTIQNTYVSNGKGYINGTEITQVNNSETLGGMPKNNGQAPFGTIPCIGNDGIMEIGRYIDYHYDNSGKYDFSTRLQTTGNYENVVSLPSASGTLALISQVLTWKSQIIDMRSYSESYWHPVTVPLPHTGYNKIKVSVQLNSGDKPSWATHSDGITCNMEIWATASGWGTTDSDTICLNYTYKFCSQNPCGWMQLGNPSLGVVFLRGGSRYTVYTDFDATFTPHNQKYTWSSDGSSQDTGGPYTSCPGLNFNMGAIRADLIATMVQARRVCAGHYPGVDNSISCSNWFRSSGNTGWYNTTYQGGWYMSDTSWIRAHNNVGIYTGGQIYSSSSIKMGNILLEHTDEINNITNGGINLNYRNSGNVSLCQGGGNVGIGTMGPAYKLDVNGQVKASGFHHSNHSNDDAVLLAGGGYKTLNSIYEGDNNHPVFLGYLNLDHGNDGTVSSSFSCLGYSVPFTYTRGGNYCRITIPDTTYQVFYIEAATASVNYSGGGMDTWVGYHRGSGAWWLHCYVSSTNEVKVKGFRQSNDHNDSWWGGNPLWSNNDGANKITVCIFGYVKIINFDLL